MCTRLDRMTLDLAASTEAHRRGRRGHHIDAVCLEAFEGAGRQSAGEGLDLDTAFFLLARDLPLDRVVHPQRHRYELADEAAASVDAA